MKLAGNFAKFLG